MKTIIRTEWRCTSNKVVRALFISLYRCFCLFPPVPRDRKGRGARLRAPARVPGIHKTCPVASAGAKRKTVPSSEISEDSLADPPQQPETRGGEKIHSRCDVRNKGSLRWYGESVTAWRGGLHACGSSISSRENWNCEHERGWEGEL